MRAFSCRRVHDMAKYFFHLIHIESRLISEHKWFLSSMSPCPNSMSEFSVKMLTYQDTKKRHGVKKWSPNQTEPFLSRRR